MSEYLRPIGTIFDEGLAALEKQAQAALELTACVRNALPAPERDHIVSVTVRDDTLIVVTDAADWCPYIRYAQSELLAQLARSGLHFNKLVVRVGRLAMHTESKSNDEK